MALRAIAGKKTLTLGLGFGPRGAVAASCPGLGLRLRHVRGLVTFSLPDLPYDPSQRRQLLGQLTLRLHYTAAQIVLNAPALHHLGRERSDPNFNIDGFTYGSDCVRAAGQTVLLVEILEAHRMLNGASWFNGFMITLAASILTYFVIYSKNQVTIEESKSAIMKAGRMLASLGQTNKPSKQVHDSLSPYVDMVLSLES